MRFVIILISAMIIFFVFIYPQPNTKQTRKTENTIKKITLTQKQKHNKEKIIVQKLKKIPTAEIYTNLDMYKELQKLFPLNKKYNKKVAYYSKKVTELEKRIGKAPELDIWDGVPYIVEDYIKSIAKDPDSVKFAGCSELGFSNNGWITSCKVRAKNSFGGYVVDIYRFTIKHNRVVNAKSLN